MPEDTNIDLPVSVNLQLSIKLNGQEVFGSEGPLQSRLMGSTYDSDALAMPNEIYRIGNELRMRSDDGQTSVTIATNG